MTGGRAALVATLACGLAVATGARAQPAPRDPYQPADPTPPASPDPRRRQVPSQPSPPPPPPADDQSGPPADSFAREPSHDFRDFYASIGWVIYTERDSFDQRDGALELSVHRHKLGSEFFYTAFDGALGVSGDTADKDNSGFRYRAGGRLGVAFPYRSGMVAMGIGLSANGETDTIPFAITAPVEIRTSNWLSPTMRASLWARGDRLLATFDSRDQLADRYGPLDELYFGATVLFLRGKGRAKIGLGEDESPALKGIGLSASYQRTMGAGLWLISITGGATSIPATE